MFAFFRPFELVVVVFYNASFIYEPDCIAWYISGVNASEVLSNCGAVKDAMKSLELLIIDARLDAVIDDWKCRDDVSVSMIKNCKIVHIVFGVIIMID